MKQTESTLTVSLVSFNAMGLLNFDSLRGILTSRNILKRIHLTAELLAQKSPDVIAFQEVHTYSVLKSLKRRLKAYKYVAYKRYIYGARGGLVIFSKYPIEKVEYVNFKKRGTYYNKSIVGHIIRNGILVCKLKDHPLYILDTHLTPNTDFDWTENNRYSKFIEAQLQQIADVMQELVKQGNDVLIAGDFNAAKDSYLYHDFIKRSQAKDLFAKFDFPTQIQEYLPRIKMVKRIDYIFLLNKHTQAIVKATEHLFTQKIELNKKKSIFLSDHVALQTEISFRF